MNYGVGGEGMLRGYDEEGITTRGYYEGLL